VRDKRTGLQWIKSVIGYLEWRAGEPWRRLSDPEQRFDSERWDYLDAARVVREAFYSDEQGSTLHIALPVLRPAPSALPGELELAELPRKVLVAALMRENPRLTDSKILKSLKRSKLARMLSELRAAAVEPERMRA
jgi:hypothetical protein